jgi:hypothetical protein
MRFRGGEFSTGTMGNFQPACQRLWPTSGLPTTRPESSDPLSTMTSNIRVATLSGGAFSCSEPVPRYHFPQYLWT